MAGAWYIEIRPLGGACVTTGEPERQEEFMVARRLVTNSFK